MYLPQRSAGIRIEGVGGELLACAVRKMVRKFDNPRAPGWFDCVQPVVALHFQFLNSYLATRRDGKHGTVTRAEQKKIRAIPLRSER